jgi:hypothetical protein
MTGILARGYRGLARLIGGKSDIDFASTTPVYRSIVVALVLEESLALVDFGLGNYM